MKAKDYHQIIFPKQIRDTQNNILKAIEPKLKSLNYLILYNLLPLKNENCSLCKLDIETINHLIFECHKTAQIIQTFFIYLTAAGTQNQSKRNIKEMYEMNNIL